MDGSHKHRINIMKTNQPFSWRKNTPKERAAMQNDRRKPKRKARAANKEDKRRKALQALEGTPFDVIFRSPLNII